MCSVDVQQERRGSLSLTTDVHYSSAIMRDTSHEVSDHEHVADLAARCSAKSEERRVEETALQQAQQRHATQQENDTDERKENSIELGNLQDVHDGQFGAERIASQLNNTPASTMPSYLASAENDYCAPTPINVYLTASCNKKRRGAAFIWNASDVFRLRKEFRILGDFCGTLPKHTAQNQYLALPLVLSFDELHFGVQRGFLRMIRDSSQEDYVQPSEQHVATFYDTRRKQEELHAEEAVRHQEEQRLKQIAKYGHDNTQPSRGKKRPREPDPSSHRRTGAPDVSRQRPPKIPRVEELSFLNRLAFHVQGMLHRFFPAFTAAPDISSYAHEATTASSCVAISSTVATKPETDVEIVQSQEDVSQKENNEERGDTLLARRKQQARASAPILTPTAARQEERHPDEEIYDVALPVGVPRDRLLKRQIVFADLYDKGYCMSCGAKFGADFLAYAGDPLLFHAALAVIVMDANDQVTPHDIVALGRLGDSTKKRTVLAFVKGHPSTSYEVNYVGVQWEETLP